MKLNIFKKKEVKKEFKPNTLSKDIKCITIYSINIIIIIIII